VSVKKDATRWLRAVERPLVEKITAETCVAILVEGDIDKVKSEDYKTIEETWVLQRKFAPARYRTPMAKWAAWRLMNEFRRLNIDMDAIVNRTLNTEDPDARHDG
jgi:hypothetical protein